MNDQAEAVVDDLPELDESNQVDIEEPIEAEDPTEEAPETDQEVTEGGDPEYAEIEINGVTYQVPAELKDGYMMQADYTRKTQETAAERKAAAELQEVVKTQKEQLDQATRAVQQNLQKYSVLNNLDTQINEYANVDWNALNSQDPDAARQHQFHYMQLQNQRNQVYQEIQQIERQQLQGQQVALAKKLEESRSVLSREIEGFSPELEKQLVDSAVASGADRRVAQSIIADPVATKILHKAFLYDQLQVKAKDAKKPTADVKPIKTVKGGKPSQRTVYDKSLTPEQRIAMFRKGKK